MKTLHPFSLGALPLRAAHHTLTEQSSALSAMQAIADHHLWSLPADMSVADARKRLLSAPGIIFLVTDSRGRWQGVVGATELAADRILSMVSKTVTPFSLTLADVMLPRDRLQAVTLNELQYASVGDVRRTLAHASERMLLVVDADDSLCGVISADEIAERISLPLQNRARHAAEIVHQLHESHRLVVNP
ncbi:CBS domain-containing protein [Shewanella sp.]|uniref:CBS domain-containing protein n=1 Tax=Shewanella sp. TaxID=50422 RepID=UPI003566F5C6